MNQLYKSKPDPEQPTWECDLNVPVQFYVMCSTCSNFDVNCLCITRSASAPSGETLLMFVLCKLCLH